MKPIKKTVRIFFFLLISGYIVHAQNNSQCPNIDFSQGTFNGWTCKISTSQGRPSTAYNDLIWSGSNPVSGRHTIMTNINSYDQNTCNGAPNTQLALVPDGFNQSAKVGNEYTMFEADAIIYRMTVDTNNALFLLYFGVVFSGPQHTLNQQPNFELSFRDSSGNLLNIGCNRYFVVCDAGIPGFIDCSSTLHWRDWTTIGVSLFDLIGQTIDIVVATSDCGFGACFGYGYVVGECRPMEIHTRFCERSTVARLDAPDSFVSYLWRDSNGNIIGNNQRLNIQNPVIGSQYSVTMQSALGCISVLNVKIENQIINPDFTCDSTNHQCYPSGVTLTSNATTQGSKIVSFDWTISKISGVAQTEYYGTDSVFTYFFKDSGYYKITHTIINEHGCADTSSVIVYSYSNIDVNISAPSLICKNTETEITASGADVYEWTGVKRVHSDSSAIIDQAGIYIVKGFNNIGCAYDTIEIQDIDFDIQYKRVDNPCFDDRKGQINITSVTGNYIAPLHHYWEDLGYINGPSLLERKNLSAGTYILFSIDGMGCFRYDTISILQPGILGMINPIIGDTLLRPLAYYNYHLASVQGALGYHWKADKITDKGKVVLLDTITTDTSITIPVFSIDPIELSVYAFNNCDTTHKSSLNLTCDYQTEFISICPSEFPLLYKNNVFTKEGYYEVTFKNEQGNDSLITLLLSVLRLPQRPDSIMGDTIINTFGYHTYRIKSVENASEYAWYMSNLHWLINKPDTHDSITLLIPNGGYGILSVVAINQCGMSAATQLNITSGLHINNNGNPYNISVYPNPAKDKITINIQPTIFEDTEIYLYDIYGKLLLKEKMTNTSATINISPFASGIYFLKIKTDNQHTQTIKVYKN